MNYGTLNMVALDTWAGMKGCAWAWLFSCAHLGVITPLLLLVWLIPCSVLQVWLVTICGRE